MSYPSHKYETCRKRLFATLWLPCCFFLQVWTIYTPQGTLKPAAAKGAWALMPVFLASCLRLSDFHFASFSSFQRITNQAYLYHIKWNIGLNIIALKGFSGTALLRLLHSLGMLHNIVQSRSQLRLSNALLQDFIVGITKISINVPRIFKIFGYLGAICYDLKVEANVLSGFDTIFLYLKILQVESFVMQLIRLCS